jgi:hypothetical protein
MFEDFVDNSKPIPDRTPIISDRDATDRMIAAPKDTLKSIFNHVETMSLFPEPKRMALASVMMALITIIHGEPTNFS